MSTCPHCGQPMPEMRLGVRLTPLKAKIFDAVVRTGTYGIMTSQLLAVVWSEKRSKHGLRSHIWQINELIADTGYRIEGGNRWGYILVKPKEYRNAPASLLHRPALST